MVSKNVVDESSKKIDNISKEDLDALQKSLSMFKDSLAVDYIKGELNKKITYYVTKILKSDIDSIETLNTYKASIKAYNEILSLLE